MHASGQPKLGFRPGSSSAAAQSSAAGPASSRSRVAPQQAARARKGAAPGNDSTSCPGRAATRASGGSAPDSAVPRVFGHTKRRSVAASRGPSARVSPAALLRPGQSPATAAAPTAAAGTGLLAAAQAACPPASVASVLSTGAQELSAASTPSMHSAHSTAEAALQPAHWAATRVADVAGLLPQQLDAAWLLSASPLLGAGLGLASVAAWRVAAYGQLQYITAAMLSNHVPRGIGARILQVGGGARELFYYPKDAVQVTLVGEKIKKGLLEQAGVQAGVPVRVVQQAPHRLGFQGGSSVDAIVLVGGALQRLEPNLGAFLAEAARVLKPGAPLIFIERVRGEGLAAAVQPLLSLPASPAAPELLERLRGAPGFGAVQGDVALPNQDPHAVGVVFKLAAGEEGDVGQVLGAARPAGAQRQKKGGKGKGFRR